MLISPFHLAERAIFPKVLVVASRRQGFEAIGVDESRGVVHHHKHEGSIYHSKNGKQFALRPSLSPHCIAETWFPMIELFRKNDKLRAWTVRELITKYAYAPANGLRLEEAVVFLSRCLLAFHKCVTEVGLKPFMNPDTMNFCLVRLFLLFGSVELSLRLTSHSSSYLKHLMQKFYVAYDLIPLEGNGLFAPMKSLALAISSVMRFLSKFSRKYWATEDYDTFLRTQPIMQILCHSFVHHSDPPEGFDTFLAQLFAHRRLSPRGTQNLVRIFLGLIDGCKTIQSTTSGAYSLFLFEYQISPFSPFRRNSFLTFFFPTSTSVDRETRNHA
jgi:hypothetical protein